MGRSAGEIQNKIRAKMKLNRSEVSIFLHREWLGGWKVFCWGACRFEPFDK